MAKWWQVSWKRTGLALVCAFAGLFLAGHIFSGAYDLLAPWLDARAVYLNDKKLYIVPAALPDSSLANLSGTRIDAFGISFQTPWTEAPKIISKQHVSSYAFLDNGVGIVVFDPSKPLSMATTAIRKDPQMVQILGPSATHSDFELLTSALSSTPSEVRWWKPQRKLAKSIVLLGMKSMELGEGWPTYRVQFGAVRGFQGGSLASPPCRVHLVLFDSADHEYELLITTRKASTLSQAQLNAMIASLRPAQSATSIASKNDPK